MKIVLAIDALDHDLIEEFDCKNLKQISYGRTDISEFSQPRTIVLWSSFMTGQNKEKEILTKGDEEMWNTKIDIKNTFFSKFKNPKVIDLPGFSYDLKQHKKERELLKVFFEDKTREEKDNIREEYNKLAFEHHKKIKKEFEDALSIKRYDFILGYFSVADVIGHLNFGNKMMIRMIYKDLDEIAGRIKDKFILILSDHGMKKIGAFGDHSECGFWSLNFKTKLKNPKITDFARIITENNRN